MKLILICLLFATSITIFSQEDIMRQFEYKFHTYKNIKIPYRLFIPKLDSEKIYPLIITLHGSGERGDDNESQIKYHRLATIWAESENQKENPCFIISPQCPKGKKWVDTDWNINSYDFKSTPINDQLTLVHNLIQSIMTEYPIDKDRIYITGLSMGGFGAWYMLMKFPKLFAAAIPMSGGGDPNLSNSLKNIPTWDFHGELDKSVPVEASRIIISAFEQSGNKVLHIADPNSKELLNNDLQKNKILESDLIYTEYKNKGHVIWQESYENPLVREWLFSKRRKN